MENGVNDFVGDATMLRGYGYGNRDNLQTGNSVLAAAAYADGSAKNSTLPSNDKRSKRGLCRII